MSECYSALMKFQSRFEFSKRMHLIDVCMFSEVVQFGFVQILTIGNKHVIFEELKDCKFMESPDSDFVTPSFTDTIEIILKLCALIIGGRDAFFLRVPVLNALWHIACFIDSVVLHKLYIAKQSKTKIGQVLKLFLFKIGSVKSLIYMMKLHHSSCRFTANCCI